MEFDVIDGLPIYACTKIQDFTCLESKDLNHNSYIYNFSSRKSVCNIYHTRKKKQAKKLILQIKKTKLDNFAKSFIETRGVLKTLKLNENQQDKQSTCQDTQNKKNSFHGFSDSVQFKLLEMETDDINRNISPGPPVLTPEVDINLVRSADLRCSMCQIEKFFTDIELYNHIKSVHGDVRHSEVKDDPLCSELREDPMCRVKRKGKMVNDISTTPKKMQKGRKEDTGYEDVPKKNPSGFSSHTEALCQTNVSVAGNMNKIYQNNISLMYLEKQDNEVRKPDSVQHSPIKSTQTISTRNYSELLRDIDNQCNSSFKLFGENTCLHYNIKNDTDIKRTLFMPETLSEDSTDFFMGRMVDSVFSPIKNTTSPAKPSTPFQINEETGIPKTIDCQVSTDADQQNPKQSVGSILCGNTDVSPQHHVIGNSKKTMPSISFVNTSDCHYTNTQQPVKHCSRVVNSFPNQVTLYASAENEEISPRPDFNMCKMSINVLSNTDIVNNQMNNSANDKTCTSLDHNQQDNNVSPCVIQPAVNVPSQNNSVLSQQARFISRQLKSSVDNEDIDYVNSTFVSAGRPVSTCIIQPAVTTLTNCFVNSPGFTGTLLHGLKIDPESGNNLLNKRINPDNNSHISSNVVLGHSEHASSSNEERGKVKEVEILEKNNFKKCASNIYSTNTCPLNENVASFVDTDLNKIQNSTSILLSAKTNGSRNSISMPLSAKTNELQFVTTSSHVLISPNVVSYSSENKSDVYQPHLLHLSIPVTSSKLSERLIKPSEHSETTILGDTILLSKNIASEVNSNILASKIYHSLPDTLTVSQNEKFDNSDCINIIQDTVPTPSVKAMSNSRDEIIIQKNAYPITICNKESSSLKIKKKAENELIHCGSEQDLSTLSQGGIVLYCCGTNTNDQTITSIKQTKLENRDNEIMREGIFVVCTNCGINSAKYDECDSCHKPLPQCAKLYEPIIRQRSFSEGSSVVKVGLRQTRNLSDSAIDNQDREQIPHNAVNNCSLASPPKEKMDIHQNKGNLTRQLSDDSGSRIQENSTDKKKDVSDFCTEKSKNNQSKESRPIDITTKLDVNTLVVQLPISELWFGTFHAVPADLFKITTKGVQLTFEYNIHYINKVGDGIGLRIHIGSHDIRKIRIDFNKQYPVMLIQTSCACEQKIQHVLEMTTGKEPFYGSSKDKRHETVKIIFDNLGGFGIEKYLKLLCETLIEDHPLQLKGNVTFEEVSIEDFEAASGREIEIKTKTTKAVSESVNISTSSNKENDNEEVTLDDFTTESAASHESQENTVCLEEEDEDVIIVDEVIHQNEFQKNLAFLKPTHRRVKPKLLEIQSNCDWHSVRGRITSVMSKILGNKKHYPEPKTITLDGFNVTILPKPKQQTKVPKTLISKFESFYVYPICVKITPLHVRQQESSFIDLTKDTSCKHTSTNKNDRLPKNTSCCSPRKPGKKIVGDVIHIDC